MSEDDNKQPEQTRIELTSLKKDADVTQEEYEKRFKKIAENDDVKEALLYRTASTEDTLDALDDTAESVFGGPESPSGHMTFEKQRPLSTGNKMLLRTGRATTIPLYNSGFHITVTAPTPMDLQGFVTTVRNAANSFGSIYGAAYYLQQSSLIMSAMIDLITPRVIDSSLSGWYKEKIGAHLSIHDYDTIIAHLVSIIFNGKYENFRMICEECGHERTLTIDPRILVLRNASRLNEAQIAHMSKSAGDVVTLEEVAAYKQSLPLCDHTDAGLPLNTFVWSDDSGKYIFHLQEATVSRYKVGNTTYGDRIRKIVSNLEAAGKMVDLDDIITANILVEYMPWIEKIVQVPNTGDENDTLVAATPVDIIEVLEVLMGYDTKKEILKKLDKVIKAHKVTHLGYMAEPCSKCGHVEGEHGIVTLDPNTLLFLAASSKLTALASE